MKKLLLSTFAFCLFTFALAQQYGWKNLTPNLPVFQYDTIYNIYGDTIVAGLMDLCFISDNEGWIVASNGNPVDGGAVLHTTDGGENWDAYPIVTGCLAIQMLDANTGYAGGFGGIVWKTANGGETWTYHGTITNTLSDIEFPPQPADTGYAGGLDGKAAMITPSGVTMMDPGIVGGVYHLSFPTSKDEGWFVGEGWGMIRHFYNGQWLPDQIHISGYHEAVDFIDNEKGWAVGDRILHTSDGQEWNEQTNHPVLLGALTSVFFLDQNQGWAVGTVGQVLKTINGGEQWSKEDLGTNAFFTDVQFTSSINGYVVGNNKTLYKFGSISGIKKSTSIDLQIYPNPAKEKFQAQSVKFKVQDAAIKIFDLSGRKLLEKQIPAGNETVEIDASRLQNGMYLVQLQFENQTVSKKLFVQK